MDIQPAFLIYVVLLGKKSKGFTKDSSLTLIASSFRQLLTVSILVVNIALPTSTTFKLLKISVFFKIICEIDFQNHLIKLTTVFW